MRANWLATISIAFAVNGCGRQPSAADNAVTTPSAKSSGSVATVSPAAEADAGNAAAASANAAQAAAAAVDESPSTDRVQSNEDRGKIDAIYDDHRWYAVVLKVSHCFPEADVFDVSTPEELERKYKESEIPFTVVNGDGDDSAGKEDGDRVILSVPGNPIPTLIPLVKGRAACTIFMKLAQAKMADSSPYN